MRKKIDYNKYLRSRDWLIKKSKLVNRYLKRKWNIDCIVCNITDNLIIHHWNYRNIGNEDLDDLCFMCFDCHTKLHKNKNFKDNWISEFFDLFTKNTINNE